MLAVGRWANVNITCFLMSEAANIGYRNNWCINEGNCETCRINANYEDGGLELKLNAQNRMPPEAVMV